MSSNTSTQDSTFVTIKRSQPSDGVRPSQNRTPHPSQSRTPQNNRPSQNHTPMNRTPMNHAPMNRTQNNAQPKTFYKTDVVAPHTTSEKKPYQLHARPPVKVQRPPKLCTFYEEFGYCKFGDSCYFAHRTDRQSVSDPRFSERRASSSQRDVVPTPKKVVDDTIIKEEMFPTLKSKPVEYKPIDEYKPVVWPSVRSDIKPIDIKPIDVVSSDESSDTSMDFSVDPKDFLKTLSVRTEWYDEEYFE